MEVFLQEKIAHVYAGRAAHVKDFLSQWSIETLIEKEEQRKN